MEELKEQVRGGVEASAAYTGTRRPIEIGITTNTTIADAALSAAIGGK
jgi:hypothetical protein